MKQAFFVGVVLMISGSAAAAPNLGEVQPERTPDLVYAQTCGYCHGRNIGPIILGRKLSPELVKVMVRSGPNGMPAFRQTEISDIELASLSKWISRSKKNKLEMGR
jgi:mono/diheme cytochrome c family protein